MRSNPIDCPIKARGLSAFLSASFHRTWALFAASLLLFGCKISQLESDTRSLNRDLDLLRSPYQFKVAEDQVTVLRFLREMPVGETVADPVLRADIEKAIGERLDGAPKITEIRIFETQPHLRREIWVAEQSGKRLAFDVHLRPITAGGVNLTINGPEEIHGNL